MSLANSAARGGAATLGGQFARFAVQMVAVAVLARLVDPSDFGLFAMVLAIVGIATLLGDFGLSTAAIQSQSLSDQQRSNLFWTNALLGLFFSILVFIGAGLIAAFYGRPELLPITQALSITFLINALASQFRAEVTRKLRFKWLAATDVSAVGAALVVAILVAASGGGYWALVTQQIVIAGVTLVLLVFASAWIPNWPRRVPMRSLYTYGLNTLGTQAITYVTSNIDDVLIGRVWGSAALGVYSRAFQLFKLPLLQIGAPMTKVALPILSRLQDDPRYELYIHRAQIVLGYAFGGLFFVLAGVADPVIDIMLGPGWDAAKPIFAILAVGGVFQGIGFVYYWIFLSRALTGLQFRWGLIGRAIMVALMIAGVFFGPLGVAVASTVGQVLIWAMTTIFPMRWSGVKRRPLLAIAIRPLILFTPMAILAMAGSVAISGWNAWLELGALSIFMALYLSLATLLSSVVRADLAAIWDVVRRLDRRR